MDESTLYYVDGYHGGIRGHMPLGCWRDILEALRTHPDWKLSLDVEPVSFDFLAQRDPRAYDELRHLLEDPAPCARLEIVSGSYAQPYGWVIGGESNIRHLTLGLAKLKEHFPWLEVTTYAVQEPCWTSALPQLLASLGFTRAVLKNPSTAWGGYAEGKNAEVCLWEGPDGTRIPLVPRYGCEGLIHVWETEACLGKPEYVKKCVDAGIRHPTGMCYQDLGWPAKPKLAEPGEPTPDHVRYVTWKEYFEQIADAPEASWRVSQEAFRGALPWGERLLVRMARQVRRTEVALLDTERLCALSYLLTGQRFDERLDEAWKHLLMAQHHDGWICAAAGKGEENWAWLGSAETYAAQQITAEAGRLALIALGELVSTEAATAEETLLVCNPLAAAETRLVRAEITTPQGTRHCAVFDGARRLRSQYVPIRTYADGSICAGELLFEADLPGLGAKSFSILPEDEAPETATAGVRAWVESGFAYLENDWIRLSMDLAQGGVVTSLIDRGDGTEWIDVEAERGFHEYRGYFINQQRFCSNREHPAEAEVLSNGPEEAALELKGQVGGVLYRQRIAITAQNMPVQVEVTFDFPDHTHIGDPKEIVEHSDLADGYRSHHNGRYKLNAYFPTSFLQERVDKDAAFDVCRSALADTHFARWQEIKHNILLHWVDVCDENLGLMIGCDHTTSYTHGAGEPLGITMAWGWDGGFWWGRRELKGQHTLRYAFFPHSGNFCAARLSHIQQLQLHQPRTQRVSGKQTAMFERKLVTVAAKHVETSAALLDPEGRLLVRLFNAGETETVRVAVDKRLAARIELVTLDGRVESVVTAPRVDGEEAVFTMKMPSFGIKTLRFTQ